jgi:hypothetical protein
VCRKLEGKLKERSIKCGFKKDVMDGWISTPFKGGRTPKYKLV